MNHGLVPTPSMGRLYIYLHEWLILMVNVAKYTVRPMDPMGYNPYINGLV